MSLHVDTLQCVSARTHLQGLKVTVGRSREEFLNNLVALFPHEANGIHKFYGICWDIFRWWELVRAGRACMHVLRRGMNMFTCHASTPNWICFSSYWSCLEPFFNGTSLPTTWSVWPQFLANTLHLYCSLNELELKSLEEPFYLAEQFMKHPFECLGLVPHLTSNTGVRVFFRLGFRVCTCTFVCSMCMLDDPATKA